MNATWLTIAVAGAGAFAMRASFLLAAHRMVDVPPVLRRVLRQIPPAALAALVVPAFLRPEGRLDLLHPHLAAGAVAAVVAWRTRDAGLTLVVGMVLATALDALWG